MFSLRIYIPRIFELIYVWEIPVMEEQIKMLLAYTIFSYVCRFLFVALFIFVITILSIRSYLCFRNNKSVILVKQTWGNKYRKGENIKSCQWRKIIREWHFSNWRLYDLSNLNWFTLERNTAELSVAVRDRSFFRTIIHY